MDFHLLRFIAGRRVVGEGAAFHVHQVAEEGGVEEHIAVHDQHAVLDSVASHPERVEAVRDGVPLIDDHLASAAKSSLNALPLVAKYQRYLVGPDRIECINLVMEQWPTADFQQALGP